MSKDDEIDLVSSHVYPGLERSPGDNDNWVERAGGLPSYIERIAKHLHYEQGMTISHAIATAVNTVKRWALGGTVTEHGTIKRITPATQAKAIKAVAEWETKKARGDVKLSFPVEELTRDEKIFLIDLALTKDGRKSFKRQGRWGHGFVPLDAAAKRSKAKGSPIAAKRINRLYGGRSSDLKGTLKSSKGGSTERTSTGRVATNRRALTPDSTSTQRLALNKHQSEHKLGGGIKARSSKPWEEIKEADKVTRNGKRYVRSVYRGKEQLVEWTGQYGDQAAPDPSRRVLQSIRTVDAQRMTTAQIRRLLKVPGQTAAAKKTLNSVLRAKVKEQKTS